MLKKLTTTFSNEMWAKIVILMVVGDYSHFPDWATAHAREDWDRLLESNLGYAALLDKVVTELRLNGQFAPSMRWVRRLLGKIKRKNRTKPKGKKNAKKNEHHQTVHRYLH